jgi:hypothetical protein
MASNVPAPYFPTPPTDYNRNYMDQVIRAFSVFVQQVNNPGPIRGTTLTLNPTGSKIDSGELSYSTEEDTFNLTHLDGVVQHIGFDTFMRCRNGTGSMIPRGTVVGFAGVNGEINVSPYIANSSASELFFVGVTAFDMDNLDVGAVYVYGKLHNINTTGTPVGETWAAGDILYASATTAGRFTKVRPTAPNVVISVAAVLTVSATVGEIMIRPTIPIGLDYGTFSSTVDQTVAAINTATAVTYNTTEISNGVTLGSPASRIVVAQAGYYHVSISVQVSSTNASSKNVFLWLDKNGSNVADTARAISLSGNGTYLPFAATYDISLAANDYVRLMWAASDTNVALDAFASTAFHPTGPSAIVSVTQMQL